MHFDFSNQSLYLIFFVFLTFQETAPQQMDSSSKKYVLILIIKNALVVVKERVVLVAVSSFSKS